MKVALSVEKKYAINVLSSVVEKPLAKIVWLSTTKICKMFGNKWYKEKLKVDIYSNAKTSSATAILRAPSAARADQLNVKFVTVSIVEIVAAAMFVEKTLCSHALKPLK